MQGSFALHLKEWGRQVNILSGIFYYTLNCGIKKSHQDISPALPCWGRWHRIHRKHVENKAQFVLLMACRTSPNGIRGAKLNTWWGDWRLRFPVWCRYAAPSLLSIRSINQERETSLVTTGKWFSLCHSLGRSQTLKEKQIMWIIRNNRLALSRQILPKLSSHQRKKLVQTEDFFF